MKDCGEGRCGGGGGWRWLEATGSESLDSGMAVGMEKREPYKNGFIRYHLHHGSWMRRRRVTGK